jgi:hypothetical protein
VIGAENVDVTGNWFHDARHSYPVGVSASGKHIHSPPWPSRNVRFEKNRVDRPEWLSLESARDSTTVVPGDAAPAPEADSASCR